MIARGRLASAARVSCMLFAVTPLARAQEPSPAAPAAPESPETTTSPEAPTATPDPSSAAFPLPPPEPAAPDAAPAPSVAPSAAPPPPAAPARATEPRPAPKRSAPEWSFIEPSSAESASQPSESPSRSLDRDRDRESSGEDQFKIGPLLGVGVPSLVSVGLMLKVTRFLGAGVNVGFIPKVKLSYYGDATLSYQHYDVYGRVYPFGGGFFLGAGAGYATVRGTLDKSVATDGVNGLPDTLTYESRGSVRTLMLTALLGYLKTFDSGFTLGVDAGAQIPIASSDIEFERSVNGNFDPALVDRYLAPVDADVRDTLETIGRTTLPTVNLRIGWVW